VGFGVRGKYNGGWGGEADTEWSPGTSCALDSQKTEEKELALDHLGSRRRD
jgi:hypothetical protein